jgi:FixJ family two-component response regulator
MRFTQCTARELQVLDHLVAGASNKQVADALDISIKTVEVHRARLMEKTESASFAELVRLALARETR